MPERQTATNGRTGEESVTEVSTTSEAYTEALLRERAGYVQRGMDARVAEVDAELERAGVSRPQAHKATERAVTPPAERRRKAADSK